MKIGQALLFGLFLLWLSGNSLSAETTSYPEKNAVFSVEIPHGWKASYEHGALKIAAEVNAVCIIQHVDNVKDEATAKEALPQLAELEGKQFDLHQLMISVPGKSEETGEIKGFGTDGRGISAGGNDTFWHTLIFSPKEGDYYLITCLWASADGETTRAARADLFRSLRPIGLF